MSGLLVSWLAENRVDVDWLHYCFERCHYYCLQFCLKYNPWSYYRGLFYFIRINLNMLCVYGGVNVNSGVILYASPHRWKYYYRQLVGHINVTKGVMASLGLAFVGHSILKGMDTKTFACDIFPEVSSLWCGMDTRPCGLSACIGMYRVAEQSD